MIEMKSLDYLNVYKSEINSRVDGVIEKVPNLPHDCALFLVGSIVDGLASNRSDIDLLVVETKEHDRLPEVEYCRFTDEEQDQFEVDFLSLKDIERLEAIVLNTKKYIDADVSSLRGIKPVSVDDELLLHDLRVGIPLQHQRMGYELKQRLLLHELPQHVAFRRAIDYHDIKDDVAIQIEMRNVKNARWMLNQCAVHVSFMLLASIGETNPREKWLISLLERYGDCITQEDSTSLKSVLLSRRGPASDDEDELQFCVETLDRLDQIFNRVVEKNVFSSELLEPTDLENA